MPDELVLAIIFFNLEYLRIPSVSVAKYQYMVRQIRFCTDDFSTMPCLVVKNFKRVNCSEWTKGLFIYFEMSKR